MNKQKTLLIVLIGVLLLASSIFIILVSNNGSTGKVIEDSELTEVKFGYQPFGSNLPFFVAVEKGFFEERGIKVVPINILSANDAALAMEKGNIVGDATIPLNVILSIEEKQPNSMKIFMIKTTSKNAWSDYLIVSKESKINDIEDLEGKTIGIYPGSAQKALIKIILGKFIEIENVNIIELPPTVQVQALLSGQIDALLTYDQVAIYALNTGDVKILEEHPLKHVIDPLYGFPYVLSSDFVEENHQDAKKIIEGFNEAIEYIKTNEEESRIIMSKWTNVDEAIAKNVALWDQVKLEEIDREALQKLSDIFYEEGVVNKRIDTSNLYF